MTHSARCLAAFATIAVLVAACVTSPRATPSGSLNPGEMWVPVADWRGPDGQPLLCAGGGFVGDFRLHGSATDPRVVWMIGPDGRTELAWPRGYRARFVPELEVVASGGIVVGREGSRVDGGCQTAEAGVMSVTLAPGE